MDNRSTMRISRGSPYASEEQYRQNREMLIDPYTDREGGGVAAFRRMVGERYGWSPEETERIGLAKVYADSMIPNAFGINFVNRGVADALRRDAIRRTLAARRMHTLTREQLDTTPEQWSALMRYLP